MKFNIDKFKDWLKGISSKENNHMVEFVKDWDGRERDELLSEGKMVLKSWCDEQE